MMAGRFITFEGGEGAGKSTQAQLLAQRLEAAGIEAVLTREPGGTAGAEEIRALLVTGSPGRWSPMSETLLLYAARDAHLRDVIRPALEAGNWVLCDRFHDSTRVYQGVAGGVDEAFIHMLEDAVLQDTRPELTLVFDLAPKAGLARAGNRGSGAEHRFEEKGVKFHETLRLAFLDLAAAEPERCVVIDADRDAEAVADDVWETVRTRLLEA